MLNKKIARRYAKALIEIGKEGKQIKQFQEELNAFCDLLRRFPELGQCLSSPLYSAEELKQIIAALDKRIGLSKTVRNFLCLLVDKRRIQYLEDIAETYEDLTNEIFGFVKAKITTAAPLSDDDCENVKKALEDAIRKKILLETKIEPQIVGGVIAEVGDRVFDGSLRNQLQKIGETLV